MAFQIPGTDAATVEGRIGRYSVDPKVLAAVRGATAGNGEKFDLVMASAAIESGFNPAAQAKTSSASGLYQFTEQTWLNAVREHGAAHGLAAEAAVVVRQGGGLDVVDPAMRQRIMDLRKDPKVSTEMAVDDLQGLADQLGASLGRPADAAETYLGHFLGSAGATQVLQALQATPDRPAADVLPAAARANNTMFYATDGTPLTMTQFVQRIRDRVGRAYAELGAPMPTSVGSGTAGRADGPEAGATGWGSNTPAHRTTTPERMVMATLAEVFTRVDRSTHRSPRNQHGLPQSVVSALGASGTGGV